MIVRELVAWKMAAERTISAVADSTATISPIRMKFSDNFSALAQFSTLWTRWWELIWAVIVGGIFCRKKILWNIEFLVGNAAESETNHVEMIRSVIRSFRDLGKNRNMQSYWNDYLTFTKFIKSRLLVWWADSEWVGPRTDHAIPSTLCLVLVETSIYAIYLFV